MFVYKSNKNKHPTTLAAVMTSVSKEKRDECLAWLLKSEGIELRVYGTDGECALESGFASVYPIVNTTETNIHLQRFDHAKRDILTKLKGLNIETTKKNIQQEILRSEFGGK